MQDEWMVRPHHKLGPCIRSDAALRPSLPPPQTTSTPHGRRQGGAMRAGGGPWACGIQHWAGR
jgi:hypothetical protein